MERQRHGEAPTHANTNLLPLRRMRSMRRAAHGNIPLKNGSIYDTRSVDGRTFTDMNFDILHFHPVVEILKYLVGKMQSFAYEESRHCYKVIE